MTEDLFTHDLLQEVTIDVSAGQVAFVNVYHPQNFNAELGTTISSQASYGLSIDVGAVPPALAYGVNSKNVSGRELIRASSRSLLEVHVIGFDTPSKEADWLRAQKEEMELRNIRQDGMFARHPLRLTLARYEYTLGSRDRETSEKRLGLILRRLGVIAN